MRENSKIKKEKWGKPKLIILVRGKPGERVAQVCKAYDTSVGAPGMYDEACVGDIGRWCIACDARSAS